MFNWRDLVLIMRTSDLDITVDLYMCDHEKNMTP